MNTFTKNGFSFVFGGNASKLTTPVVVFSHLRWHSVTQRPQHILSRIAKYVPVLFVEEPIGIEDGPEGSAHVLAVSENLTVVQPRIRNLTDVPSLGSIVNKEMKKQGIVSPILWLYSPMFTDMISEIDHAALVYDCMDELAAFHGAPTELSVREKVLLKQADVVFTGGYSLYEAKMHTNPNVFCFPSSVDSSHFKKAFAATTAVPADMAAIAGPRVLFYGVVDERMDMELLAHVAAQMPAVSFIIIGPTAKISPSSIPTSTNVHYLGNRDYETLPAYLKGADVTMMPFAINEATRFISPTKTLEFMAAEKPIVSTRIRDVERFYADIVAIADTSDAFARAISTALKESATAKRTRMKKEREIIAKNSWDATVARMMEIIVGSTEDRISYTPTPVLFPQSVPLISPYGER